MKKALAALALIICMASSKSQNGYEIKINMKGIKDTVCYLMRYKWDSQYMVDTAKVKHGVFTFTGKNPIEKGLYAVLRQSKTSIYFDLPVMDVQKFSVVTDTSDMYAKMKVTGSQVNEDFRQFVIFMSDHYKKAYEYEKEVKA